MRKKEITAIIEKTSTGFSGYIKEVDGITTAGDTIEEIKEGLTEGYGYYLEYLLEKGMSELTIEEVKFNYVVDLQQFFEYFEVINKTKFAERIGMNTSLFRQYTSGKANLSDDKLLQITNGLHTLAADFSNIMLSK